MHIPKFDVVRGQGVHIHPEVSIEEYTHLIVRRYTRLNGKMLIRGSGTVEFGPFCAVGDDIKIVSQNHLMDGPSLQQQTQMLSSARSIIDGAKDITIGPNSWIGDCVVILPGVVLPPGCVVGAGTVLVPNGYDPFSVIVGNPSRAIRRRFAHDVCDLLLAIAWWNWPIERIQASKAFFDLDLTLPTAAADLRRFL